MLLQNIILVLVLFAWANAYINLRKKKINLGEFLFWSALWLTLLVFSLVPYIPSYISQRFGVGRGVDLVIYGSVFLIFFLIFKLYVRMESQEREVTSLVRELAIKRARKK